VFFLSSALAGDARLGYDCEFGPSSTQWSSGLRKTALQPMLQLLFSFSFLSVASTTIHVTRSDYVTVKLDLDEICKESK